MNGSSWNRRAKRDGDSSRGGTSVEIPERRRCGNDVHRNNRRGEYPSGRRCRNLCNDLCRMQSASEAEGDRSSVSQSIPGDSAPSVGDESERQREIQHARVQPLVQPQGDRSRGESSKFNAETELGNDTASVGGEGVSGLWPTGSRGFLISRATDVPATADTASDVPATADTSSHPGLAPSPPAASSSASSGLVCSRRELDVPDTASDDCISEADIDYSWVFDTAEDAWSCVAEAGSDIEDRGEILLRVSPLSADPLSPTPHDMVEIMVPPDATIGHFIHKHKQATLQSHTDWYVNKSLVIGKEETGIACFDCKEPYTCFTSTSAVRDNIQRLECGACVLDVTIVASRGYSRGVHWHVLSLTFGT